MFRFTSCLFVLLSSTVAAGDERTLTYEADVRPLLKTHCFLCHGEAGEREGGLDVRLRRLIVAGGDSGAAIVPGKPSESRLLERIRSGEMPPDDEKRLSADEVAIIEAWIAAGAPTARDEPETVGDEPIFTEEELSFWAFQPVARPKLPTLASSDEVASPIDVFVLARLKQEMGGNVGFASEARARKLIRRATYDLIGLPPTPDEVETFVAESSLNADVAFAQLVDRLLASPHYGERWGRHWLDVAGYSDSEGYTDEDRVRPHAWRYRDYVIRAFNNDKPYDQFVIEQLAGDELVSPPYSNLDEEAIEKLTATGFLRMAPDGTQSGGIDQNVARNQVIADSMQIVGTSLLALTLNCAQCHDHRYDPIPTLDYYALRAIFEPAFDWKAWKAPPARQISLYTDADREQAKQLESEAAEIDAARQKKVDEYLAITLEEELLIVPDDVRDALRTAFQTAGDKRTTEQTALLKEYPSVQTISAGSLYLYDQQRNARAGKIDAERQRREKQYVAAAGGGATADTLKEVNPEAAAELERYRKASEDLRARRVVSNLKTYTDRAAEVRGRKPEEGFLRALTEVPGKTPATFVFHRGDYQQPKAEMPPAALTILRRDTSLPTNDAELPTSGRRLAWARHLTSGEHPLVARVIANRIWLHHFGRGLVNSPGDFGVLGERPTHPALLDWLAAELIESGWSIKRLHRLIMTSSVYRQSSATDPNIARADPENRWYGRFRARRVEAEVLRDSVLAVTNKLNTRLYGKPVPVMEDGVGQIVIGIENLDGERKPTKTIDLHGEEFRRGIYIQSRRTRTLSFFETFDAPDMSPNCDRRNSSTVAPQSLMLMNSDFVLNYADHFAARLIADAGGTVRDQVALAWRLAYADEPAAEDVRFAEDFVASQTALIAEQSPDMDEATRQREVLSVFCQAILTSNRFLYVD